MGMAEFQSEQVFLLPGKELGLGPAFQLSTPTAANENPGWQSLSLVIG